MKRLQRYILGHTVKAFIPAFIALSLLMVVGFCMQMLYEGLDVVRLGGMLPRVFVWCVPMVLPSAFLTAVIMAFGRLRADNELLAVRAAGVHLFRVVHPVLFVAFLLALVAAWLQFETLPRARGAVQVLKYDAFKQILLNKAALSWKRRFSFPPVYIRYDDYVAGEMRGVLVLETRESSPRTIITATSAVIRSDPRRPGAVLFDMSDCVITRYDFREDSQPRTMESKRVVYHVPVRHKAEDVLSRRKFLVLSELVAELKHLRETLASGEPFADPDDAFRENRSKRNRIDIWLNSVEAALDDREERHMEADVHEPKRQRQIVARSRKAISDAEAGLDELQDQLSDCAAQLDELHADGGDLERVVALQRQRATILKEIQLRKDTIEEQRDVVRAAEQRIDQCSAIARELAVEISSLTERRDELEGRRRQLSHLMARAQAQRDLQSLTIRVHKRLTQAASVFTFALLGIPLGIVCSRRSVMIAFGLSFGIVLMVFYPFLIAGSVAAEAGSVPVAPAIWAGNVVVAALGGMLMVRVLGR
jgi:lipopolysaccharide export LptBFGC system permease protein LptF